MYGSLTFCYTAISQFLMADISFNIACKELKIAQIAQLNQLFQLLHLVHIYGHGFYELSRMLMRKNVNNDVSKDSPNFDVIFNNISEGGQRPTLPALTHDAVHCLQCA